MPTGNPARRNDLLRAARLRVVSPSGSGRSMSRQELAEAVNAYAARVDPGQAGLDANHIGKLERGQHRWPSRLRREAFRQVLGVPTDADLGFYITRRPVVDTGGVESSAAATGSDLGSPEPAAGSDSGSPGRDTKGVATTRRRSFLIGSAWATAGTVGATAALEALRHELNDAMTADGMVDVDDWRRVAAEYGTAYASSPPDSLVERLSVDMAILGDHLRDPGRERQQQELQHVAALLATCLAQGLADLNQTDISARWWRTARCAADASGRRVLGAWVRGREVIHGLYARWPLADLLATADQAVALLGGPGMATGPVLAARAQTLARIGDRSAALDALDRLRAAFDRLPSDITDGPTSVYCWTEARLRHTESFVYTHLGHPAAPAAHERALASYPAGGSVGRVQVGLHRALYRMRSGDVHAAADAHQVLRDLPGRRRVPMVLELARQVLAAVPVADRNRWDVAALRAAVDHRVPALGADRLAT